MTTKPMRFLGFAATRGARRMSRLAALALVGFAMALATSLGGCDTNPATGRSAFTAFMSVDKEQRIGATAHPDLVAEFGGLYPDPALQAYVERLGQSLVAVTERPDLAYTFVVLDDPSVNAFALPGGFVHVTRGLLALADSEAELAGVLAHEIGHLVARHPAERFSQAVAVGMALRHVSEFGAPSDAASGRRSLRQWSRVQEIEADRLGIRYLGKAGYDPAAMASFLDKLATQSALRAAAADGTAPHGDLLDTHPRTVDRVRKAAAAATATASGGRIDRDTYLDRIDGLVFGDDPRQGTRVAGEFRHPELAIAFRVPEGFRLINGPSHVSAQGPDGSLIVFDMVPAGAVPGNADLLAYVADDWGGRLGLHSVEPLQINGMEAVTGSNRIRLEQGLVDVRLVAVRERPGRTYRFMFLTPALASDRTDLDVRATTHSFRRLSAAEIAAIEPLRIAVVTVRPGQTIDDLARSMTVAGLPVEWFRALNGLPEGGSVEVGRKVKIVTR